MSSPAPRRRPSFGDAAAMVTLFALTFGVHLRSPVHNLGDPQWVIPVAVSLYHDGDLDIDEYAHLATPVYRQERVGEHLYNRFPIGGSLLALPAVAAAARITGWDLHQRLLAGDPLRWIQLPVASGIVALAAVLLYLVARQRLGRRDLAAAFVVLFAFGTSAYSTASRGLWQHGPVMLTYAAALAVVVRGASRRWMPAAAGAILAFGYVCRPAALVPLALFALLFVDRGWRRWASYALGAAAVLVPFVWVNLTLYGSWLAPYYLPGRTWSLAERSASPSRIEALVGTLLSPGRGLLVFTPVFVFCVVGVALAIRRRSFGRLELVVSLAIVVHWLLLASFPLWWGGHCFGPRLFSDLTPFFCYLLLPVFAWLPAAFRRRGAPRLGAAAFVGLALASILIHTAGATREETRRWNVVPTNVSVDRDRLWDWTDPQFLR